MSRPLKRPYFLTPKASRQLLELSERSGFSPNATLQLLVSERADAEGIEVEEPKLEPEQASTDWGLL